MCCPVLSGFMDSNIQALQQLLEERDGDVEALQRWHAEALRKLAACRKQCEVLSEENEKLAKLVVTLRAMSGGELA